jgi:hypothetical protein
LSPKAKIERGARGLAHRKAPLTQKCEDRSHQWLPNDFPRSLRRRSCAVRVRSKRQLPANRARSRRRTQVIPYVPRVESPSSGRTGPATKSSIDARISIVPLSSFMWCAHDAYDQRLTQGFSFRARHFSRRLPVVRMPGLRGPLRRWPRRRCPRWRRRDLLRQSRLSRRHYLAMGRITVRELASRHSECRVPHPERDSAPRAKGGMLFVRARPPCRTMPACPE